MATELRHKSWRRIDPENFEAGFDERRSYWDARAATHVQQASSLGQLRRPSPHGRCAIGRPGVDERLRNCVPASGRVEFHSVQIPCSWRGPGRGRQADANNCDVSHTDRNLRDGERHWHREGSSLPRPSLDRFCELHLNSYNAIAISVEQGEMDERQGVEPSISRWIHHDVAGNIGTRTRRRLRRR